MTPHFAQILRQMLAEWRQINDQERQALLPTLIVRVGSREVLSFAYEKARTIGEVPCGQP
jgi:hypothetical protein